MAECMLFKVVLSGNVAVGKSALLTRFLDNTIESSVVSTLSASYLVKSLEIDEQPIKLQLWDTAGHERYSRSLPRPYYRGAHGIVLVFDLTDGNSLKGVKKWLDDATEACDDDINKVLLGNKTDLADTRTVSYAQAKRFADEVGIPYFETSAKTGAGVQEAFEALAAAMKANRENSTTIPTERLVLKPGEKPYKNVDVQLLLTHFSLRFFMF